MRWMYEGAVDPAALRFVLLMRDPLERSYSNWLMFRQWNWEDEANFTRAAEVELDNLRECDPATFADPTARLPAMSQAELDAYHARCTLGGRKHLLNHVRASMCAQIGARAPPRALVSAQGPRAPCARACARAPPLW